MFEDSNKWVGIKLKEGEVGKYMWDVFGIQSESEALFGSQNARAREECAKHKIEIFCAIHIEDIQIEEHYVTTNNGVIIWCKMQNYIVFQFLSDREPLHQRKS